MFQLGPDQESTTNQLVMGSVDAIRHAQVTDVV